MYSLNPTSIYVKQGDKLFISDSGCNRCGFTLIELLVTIVVIGLLVALLLPAGALVMRNGRQTQCVANLRAIGQLFSVYASENDQRLPNYCYQQSPWMWAGRILPAGANPKIFRCPADKSKNERNYHANYFFLFYPPQDPLRTISFKSPAKTVLVYEDDGVSWWDGWAPEFSMPSDEGKQGGLLRKRHMNDTASNILFADGHVAQLSDTSDLEWLNDE